MFSNPPSSPFRKGGRKIANFRNGGRKIATAFYRMMEQHNAFIEIRRKIVPLFFKEGTQEITNE